MMITLNTVSPYVAAAGAAYLAQRQFSNYLVKAVAALAAAVFAEGLSSWLQDCYAGYSPVVKDRAKQIENDKTAILSRVKLNLEKLDSGFPLPVSLIHPFSHRFYTLDAAVAAVDEFNDSSHDYKACLAIWKNWDEWVSSPGWDRVNSLYSERGSEVKFVIQNRNDMNFRKPDRLPI